MRTAWLTALVLLGWMFGSRLSAQLVITEFMADNRGTLLDEDGEPSDWIELYNDGSTPLGLEGWSLTDDPEDPALWPLPAVELEAGAFLLVFASGKDRRDPEGELHTNFKLSRWGEYLGLVRPNGNVASHFAPQYPEQLPDRSYGRPMVLRRHTLRESGGDVAYFVPPDDELGLTWVEPDFDASQWARGPLPIGFDDKEEPSFGEFVKTNVGEAMTRVTAALYLRADFTAEQADLNRFMELRLAYNDGFVLFVNGTEVGSDNAFRTRIIRSTRGITTRPDELSTAFVGIPFLDAGSFVEAGSNVVSLLALNHTNRNLDLFCDFAVDSIEIESFDADRVGYFLFSSPAWPGEEVRQTLSDMPTMSPPGGLFDGKVLVELATATPEGEIRYTLDGTEPDARSFLYTEPVLIDRPVILKAKTFRDDLVPSRTISESYATIAPEMAEFSSDLPVFLVHTFGTQIINDRFRPGHLTVIDPEGSGDGRSRVLDAPVFRGDAAFKIRGSSTSRRGKASLSVEIQDETGDDRDVEILGFPEESDYVLYAAFDFDRALMRNAFMYELSNDVGRYAVRTRFCEVYLNRTDDPLSQSHYMGVYSFMEKIKRGEDRVDIRRLDPGDEVEPEVSGGYMFKIDRLDPGDTGFSAGGQGFGHVEPKEREITPTQRDWLIGYIDAFAEALNGPDFADPEIGYARYIDVDGWIDHHILNEFSKNPDGLRLSTYFHKDRGERMVAGPIWDFDRALGPDADARAADPVGFSSLFVAHFWKRLFEDPAFMARYRERWFELRGGAMSLENMTGKIARMADEIREASVRNFTKWTILPVDGWPVEVEQFRTWVEERAVWIDSQFVPSPSLERRGGVVPAGTMVALTVEAGEIFVTTDGSDPRSEDGSPALSASLYEAPLVLETDVEIRARTRLHGEFWSEFVAETFVVESAEPPAPEALQRPGDFNQDRRVNLTDALDLLGYLAGSVEHPCTDPAARQRASDFGGNGTVDLTDVLGLLNFLFQNGSGHVLGSECVLVDGCPAACE